MVAAELVALERGDPDVCQCCTAAPERRPAIDRLRVENQRLGIASWAHRMMPLTEHYRRGRVA